MRVVVRVFAWLCFCPWLVMAGPLPPETPEAMRPHLQTLQRYYQQVDQQLGHAPPRAVAAAAPAANADAKRGQPARVERDPFDVTPELRSQRPARGGTSIGASLYPALTGSFPQMTVKAIVSGSRPAALILLEPGKERGEPRLMRLYEGDSLTLEDGTNFRVKAIRPGVISLQFGPNPQDEYLLR